METSVLTVIIFLCICFLVSSIFSGHFFYRRRTSKLPPGPPSIPMISSLLWLCTSPLHIESRLRSFIPNYGPILQLPIALRPAIFIADRSIAHTALVRNAALFADRPPALALNNIASAPYGPHWRLLRRNLTSQILNPSRIKSFARARTCVLDTLLNRLLSQSRSGTPVLVMDHFRYAMFCLLALMCFGDKLDESLIKKIENVQRKMLLNLQRFIVLNFCPKLTKILFRKQWRELLQLKSEQTNIFIPLINARKRSSRERQDFAVSYVDTLLDLEKKKLTDDEMVMLCSEFLNAGTDTTSTTLQWIMANLVKHQEIQNKVYAEMKGVMGDGEKVKEKDLEKLPYLKAVVLEGLRRHPPQHFVIPHAVKDDTKLENYVIPKNGSVHFLVAEMGWDPKAWEDPMAFRPERFMAEAVATTFDLTGRKEIKMMPFGAGRRMCPAVDLAMLHLEYFIANLVWRFQWKAMDGDDVDLSEKMEFTVVMEKPLKINIHSRF